MTLPVREREENYNTRHVKNRSGTSFPRAKWTVSTDPGINPALTSIHQDFLALAFVPIVDQKLRWILFTELGAPGKRGCWDLPSPTTRARLPQSSLKPNTQYILKYFFAWLCPVILSLLGDLTDEEFGYLGFSLLIKKTKELTLPWQHTCMLRRVAQYLTIFKEESRNIGRTKFQGI